MERTQGIGQNRIEKDTQIMTSKFDTTGLASAPAVPSAGLWTPNTYRWVVLTLTAPNKEVYVDSKDFVVAMVEIEEATGLWKSLAAPHMICNGLYLTLSAARRAVEAGVFAANAGGSAAKGRA